MKCMADSDMENRNAEGEMILESAAAMNMIIANTWFKKRGADKKVTFVRNDECKSAIDFILVRKSERAMVADVNVICTEEFIPQHRLLICKVKLSERILKRKHAFVSRTRGLAFERGGGSREIQGGS